MKNISLTQVTSNKIVGSFVKPLDFFDRILIGYGDDFVMCLIYLDPNRFECLNLRSGSSYSLYFVTQKTGYPGFEGDFTYTTIETNTSKKLN